MLHLISTNYVPMRRRSEWALLAGANLQHVQTHRWPPLFLQQAGGGRWLTWQSTIYGNVLRVIALLQICVLVPANELWNRGHTAAATPLLVLLAADALLFTLTGPTPLTPLGNVATFIVWKRRGSVAPLGPYKASLTLQ